MTSFPSLGACCFLEQKHDLDVCFVLLLSGRISIHTSLRKVRQKAPPCCSAYTVGGDAKPPL